jgi:osmotically-inducible protein OsmY
MSRNSNNNDGVNEQLQNAFSHHPHLLKNKFHFDTRGRVVVEGKVDTYFEKQLAQEALRNMDGVNEIRNDLVVSW